MTAADVAVLVAAIVAGTTSVVLIGVVIVLGRRVGELGRAVEDLRGETVPLVRDARVVVDQAATEMARVSDVLDSTEAVSATVDSASRLAYRALANPVVKVLAYGTGMGSALRRFFGRTPANESRRVTSIERHRSSARPRAEAPGSTSPAVRTRRHTRATR
jgi:hypothetical protein